MITFSQLIAILWIAWVSYWIAAAGRAKPARWRESLGAGMLHLVPLLAAACLLIVPRWPWPFFGRRLLPSSALLPYVAVALIAVGLGVTVWARQHLGRNWSGRIELKEDHVLIRTGPYKAVRHPIYSGLLLALVGTALAINEYRGAFAVALALIGCLVRIQAEETRMRQSFPEYSDYRKQTATLIPFLL